MCVYKFTNIVRAKNYNELLQSVLLLMANNVCSKFIRYVRYIYFFIYHQFRWYMKLLCWDWILPKIMI